MGLFKAENWGSSEKALLNKEVAHREGTRADRGMATAARSMVPPASPGPPEVAKRAVLREQSFAYLLLFSFTPEALGKAVAWLTSRKGCTDQTTCRPRTKAWHVEV